MLAPPQGFMDPRMIETVVTTNDATVTTLATISILDNSNVILFAFVTAFRTNGADQAGYNRNAVIFRRAAGIATIQGAVQTALTRESDATWDCTIDVDGGNNARIRVTGAVGHDINWRSRYQVIGVV